MGTLHIISRKDQPFTDRADAGHRLCEYLERYKNGKVVVLGILRGGVILAREIAFTYDWEMDLIFVRKLRMPGNPELALGAISENGNVVLDKTLTWQLMVPENHIETETERVMSEISRRIELYRKIKPKVDLAGKTVIVTDDGVATGSTMQASLIALREEHPKRLIAALPVGPEDTVLKLSKYCDEIICLRVPPFFQAVGQFYLSFEQVNDEELVDLLKQDIKNRLIHHSSENL